MEFETILKLPQNILKQQLGKTLKQIGYNPLSHKGFLYAKGTIPVLLVAHLDTVHRHLPDIICHSQNNRIIISPYGIGGDMLDGYSFFIDKSNAVYEYDFDYGCATPIEANAFNAYNVVSKLWWK